MSKTIVACVEDLFFRSKIEATARHLNVPVRFTDVRGLAGALGDGKTAALLLELSSNGETLEAVRRLRRTRALATCRSSVSCRTWTASSRATRNRRG